MRFFCGLSMDETAKVLNISPQSVMRGRTLAKAWLMRALGSWFYPLLPAMWASLLCKRHDALSTDSTWRNAPASNLPLNNLGLIPM